MKSRFILAALVLMLSCTIANVNATPLNNSPLAANTTLLTPQQIDARMEEMKLRVKEIREMDRSTLTREQRKDLRLELKGMNKEARRMGHNGVYISVGALIIIILLLILIL